MPVRKVRHRLQNGGTVWRWIADVAFTDSHGKLHRLRQVSPVQNKRGAQQFEHQLRAELLTSPQQQEVASQKHEEAPPTPPRCTPRFEQFAEEFLTVYADTNNKPSERDTKRTIFRQHLLPAFGKMKLDDVTVREIERFKAGQKALGYAPKTINNQLTVLRKLLSVAEEWGLLNSLPRFKWMPVPEQKFDFLSFEEAERLMAGADPEWRAMIVTGLKTGLRLGELRGLRWEDLDLVAGQLTVRQAVARNVIGTPKNGKTRVVPLSNQAKQALKEHRHLRGEYVFCREDGSLLTKEQCKWPLWRACWHAHLRHIGWHVLRHTFASHLTMRGIPLKVVQELLGHSTIQMTMRYAHLSPEVHQQAVQVLDAVSASSSNSITRSADRVTKSAGSGLAEFCQTRQGVS